LYGVYDPFTPLKKRPFFEDILRFQATSWQRHRRPLKRGLRRYETPDFEAIAGNIKAISANFEASAVTDFEATASNRNDG